jgi:hypothetical protein
MLRCGVVAASPLDQIGCVLEELRQRRFIEHTGENEAVQVKRSENLAHYPAGHRSGLGPKQHQHAALAYGGLDFVAQQYAETDIGMIDPRLQSAGFDSLDKLGGESRVFGSMADESIERDAT